MKPMIGANRRVALGTIFCVLACTSLAQAEPTIARSIKLPVSGVYQIAFNPADGDIYAAAVGPRGENSAAVIHLDGETLEVLGTIDVSDSPVLGLNINAETQVLYGTSTRGGSMSIIDLSGEIATIASPAGAATHLREVEVDETNDIAYASAMARDEPTSSIWVIDGADRTLDRIITVDVAGVTGLALDEAGHRLFVSGIQNNEVAVVDLGSDELVAVWPSHGERPLNVTYDAAGGRLFVPNFNSDTMAVLDAETGELLASVQTGEGPLDVAYDLGLQRIYVTNRKAGTVTVFDGTSYDTIATIETGTYPQTIAIDPATSVVYVSNKAQGLPRNAPEGAVAPEDPNGDTVVMILP